MSESVRYAHIELFSFDGYNMPRDFFTIKERIESFDVRNEDIWVTSYPKAGTTWCQEMVWLLANDLNYEKAQTDLDIRVPFIEINCLEKAQVDFFKKYHNIDLECKLPDIIEMLKENPGKRIIKSHLPWNFLPSQLTNGVKTPKIIHIMRDPNQTAISYYHHNKDVFQLYLGDLNDFLDIYINGKLEYGSYFDVVLSYWKQRHLPNILFLTYEEMRSDLKDVIKKVSQFIGKSYDEEEIVKLAHHLSFDQMKNNNAVNKQVFIQNEGRQFIRTGTTDGYKKELSGEMIAKLDRWVAEHTKGTGLPYETI